MSTDHAEYLEHLPWPKDLFGQSASIAELLAEDAQLREQGVENPDGMCAWECLKAYNNNVMQMPGNSYGRGFHMLRFSPEAYKGNWNRERMWKPENAL
ncbi:MAG TPA: hypothetical protein VME47_07315 [Acetobacteraceae bacterium]|nr:hypothetical protein [Acetobacteraceae bacterium]